MRHRFTGPIALVACLLAAASVSALQPTPEAQPAAPAGGSARQPSDGRTRQRAEGPNLEGAMKSTNRALRTLKDQVADTSKRAENLRLVNDAQRGIVTAKGMPLPAGYLRDAKDDAAKAEINEKFRSQLSAALRALLDLEDAIASGKTDEASAKLAEVIKLRTDAHHELGVKDD